MHSTNCQLCGSNEKNLITKQSFPDHYLDMIGIEYKNKDRNIVGCKSCGFIYRDPTLDDSDLRKLYSQFRDMSFRNETPDEYFDRIVGLPLEESENVARIGWLHNLLPDRLKKIGCVLDIGCGGGVFLHTFMLMNPGWEVCGVEPTSSFAQLASRRLNSHVIDGSYEPGLFSKKFDLITINQVLEHVQSPVDFMRGVASDLAPNGYIYLEVPDVRDFDYLPPNHDRFLMQHLSIFSAETLKSTCLKAGLKVQHIKHAVTIRKRHNLIAICSI